MRSLRRSSRTPFTPWLAAALLTVRVAIAGDPEPPSADATALAQTLFEEGRRFMEAHEFAMACPKLEESQRLRPGTGTLLNLALCNEAIGKSATAWGQFKEVLFASKKDGNEAREVFAQEHIAALEPKLSRLQVDAEATPGLAIQRDGQEIPAAALGTPIPLDPGKHAIEATAPGYSVWSTSIDVSAAETKTVAIPKLTPLPAAAPSPAAPRRDAAADHGEDQPLGGRRAAGFVLGGVGVVSVGVGAVLGLMAAGDASAAEDDPNLCPARRCTPAGREAIDAADTKALASTLGFGFGIAAIGAGAALILTSGPSAATTPTARLVPALGPQGAGIGFSSPF